MKPIATDTHDFPSLRRCGKIYVDNLIIYGIFITLKFYIILLSSLSFQKFFCNLIRRENRCGCTKFGAHICNCCSFGH